MKYFRVTNDILKTDLDGNPSWTDEPLWLRNEIDTWKDTYGSDIGGGRFFASSDAKYSYIISPNEDLMDLAQDDLEELTESEIEKVIAIAFPPQVISREGEPDEIIPTPSLEKVCSIYWGYATNHTGTISASESWTLANNDHHITGNITLSANVVLTIDAGVNVYYDGSYSITRTAGSGGTTTITAVGTAALPITWESNASRTNTAQYNTITKGITGANNCATTLQYCNIANFATFMDFGYSSFTTTLDHLSFRDCGLGFSSALASSNPTMNISNSRFIRMTQASLAWTTVTSGTSTATFTDCEWRQCWQVVTGTQSGGTVTANFVDCAFLDRTTMSPASGNTLSSIYHNFTRCLIDCSYISYTTAIPSLTDCIYTRSTIANGFQAPAGATNNISITTCDIMGLGAGASTGYAVSNVSTAATTITLISCYISGFRGADIFNYYTGSGSETPAQTSVSAGGAITFTTPRTTRNFPFTQSSITAGSITSSGVTISWTGSFRTMNRLALGTTSGTYTTTYTKDDSWTDYDGKGKMTASPSFAITGLSSGTTYYYQCESWDWVRQMWVKSAESSFATSASAPTFSGISSLTDLSSLTPGVLAGWSSSTGTTTEYKVYIKKDNATNLFTDTYYKCKVPSTQTSVELYTYADNTTNIANGDNVYVGVRACNSADCDTNTTSLNVTATSGSAPTFAGVTSIENIGNGDLECYWSAGTGTITNYNIYIKVGSAPLFTEKPYKVDSTARSFAFNRLIDGTKLLDSNNVYVSVRAENGSTLIDTNTAVVNIYPIGSGDSPVVVADAFNYVVK